jgi:YVTN family beta-propeller protein
MLAGIASLSQGQWVETTVPLPDSMPGLSGISVMQYHPNNHSVYVGGTDGLLVVDGETRGKTARLSLPGAPYFLCSSTKSNKLYCAREYERPVWVVDCATNSLLATVTVDSAFRDMCYASAVNKVYVACSQANSVNVIGCATDSVVARIGSLPGASAVCYNPSLNRVYAAQSGSDEVAVIDCAADTVIRTIWVRGVDPTDICYDSASNSVYTANHTSSTISVIDCAGDSLLSVVPVGDHPGNLLVGSHGKVYCSVNDSILTVVHGGGTRAISMGDDQYLPDLSYDPQDDKVYWSGYDFESDVVIVDGVGDSIVSRIGRDAAGVGPRALCYDPAGNGTWEVTKSGSAAGLIDGTTNQFTGMVLLGVLRPGYLRYNSLNNHLYCLAGGSNSYLVILDGNTNHVLKVLPEDLPAGYSVDSMVWNPANDKLYLSNSRDNTVSILDCARDSIVATIGTQGDWPKAMCCSDDGKVYALNEGGSVAVIDPSGDTVRKVIPVSNGTPHSICYDRTDNKVYVGKWWHTEPVSVIDVNTDSVVAALSVGVDYQCLVWDRNHDKVYVYTNMDSSLAVIDCANDTVLKIMAVPDGMRYAYSDSLSDRVYFANNYDDLLRIMDPGADTFYHRELTFNGDGFMIDNGRSGAANRLYCTDYWGVTVVATNPKDTVLRSIQTGEGACALAWNPTHSWVYVSNSDSASITVVRDTLLSGLEENRLQVSSYKPRPTVVRGVLFLPKAASLKPHATSLLDISGRKVLDLLPGPNDVRALAPGVYFVREAQAQAQAQAVRKVIVTK